MNSLKTWPEVVSLGTEIHFSLQESLGLYPSREEWQHEFLNRYNPEKTIPPSVMDELWEISDAAGRELDFLGKKDQMPDVVTRVLWRRTSKSVKAQEVFNDYNSQFLYGNAHDKFETLNKDGTISNKRESMKTKILIITLAAFILTCLFPPWLNALDVPYHAHQRTPAGHEFILFPPASIGGAWSVEIDFGRLFLEWAALAAVTGMVWLLKPAWLRGNRANSPQ